MDLKDEFLREEARFAEEELQSWQSTRVQIRVKLVAVGRRLGEIYTLPEKPLKKRNYVLKKVEEPPSDNE